MSNEVDIIDLSAHAKEANFIDSSALLRVSVDKSCTSNQRLCAGTYSRKDVAGHELWFHLDNDRVLFFEESDEANKWQVVRGKRTLMHGKWRIGCHSAVPVLSPSRTALGLQPRPPFVELDICAAYRNAMPLCTLLNLNGCWKCPQKTIFGPEGAVTYVGGKPVSVMVSSTL
jgi:hypothetical protein